MKQLNRVKNEEAQAEANQPNEVICTGSFLFT